MHVLLLGLFAVQLLQFGHIRMAWLHKFCYVNNFKWTPRERYTILLLVYRYPILYFWDCIATSWQLNWARGSLPLVNTLSGCGQALCGWKNSVR